MHCRWKKAGNFPLQCQLFCILENEYATQIVYYVNKHPQNDLGKNFLFKYSNKEQNACVLKPNGIIKD